MKTRTLLIASMVASSVIATSAAQAAQVAGWDFSQYFTAGRLSTDGSTGVNTLSANYSSLDATGGAGSESASFGTLLMDGTAGSSSVSTVIGSSEVIPVGLQDADYDATSPGIGDIPDNGDGAIEANGGSFNQLGRLRAEGQTNTELLSLQAVTSRVIVFQADPSADSQSGSDWSVSFGGRADDGAANVDVSFSADCSSYGAATTVALDGEDDAYSVSFGAGNATGTGCVAFDMDAGAIVDNVSVDATLPEPGVAMGLLAGLGAIAGLRRIKA